MKIHVEVDLGLSTRQKRIVRSGVVASVVIAILGVGVALAAPVNTFKDTDVLSADKMNQNFVDLDSRLTAVESRVVRTNGATKISTGGLYCATTPSSYDGPTVGGYTGAKDKCAAACGSSPTAHMCAAEELSRSLAIGKTIGVAGWYSGFMYAAPAANPSNSMADCQGWSSTANFGPTYSPGSGHLIIACGTAQPILCCD